jgi:hypothetical protein
MATLARAHNELFRRGPDEMFSSLPELLAHCTTEKERSEDRWELPGILRPEPHEGLLKLALGSDGATLSLNDWSFGQLCGLAGVSRDTVNRLSADTASRVLRETLPEGRKPLQVFTGGDLVRSVHGTHYTRLYNADLVAMLLEFATDFTPPQKARTGGTGLYCGEQDLFCFLIDPTGWAEIGDQPFAPGFFVWNSEVGCRSVGVSTFWFQAVCGNHVVWDATEVVEFARKHTGQVGEALADIRRIVEGLVAKRDARRDGFVSVIEKAMRTKLGEDAEEVTKVLATHGIGKALAKRALEIAESQGHRFTVYSVVDALTRMARECEFAGVRAAADEKASNLLALAVAA